MSALVPTVAGAGRFCLIILHASSLTTQDCPPLAARLLFPRSLETPLPVGTGRGGGDGGPRF